VAGDTEVWHTHIGRAELKLEKQSPSTTLLDKTRDPRLSPSAALRTQTRVQRRLSEEARRNAKKKYNPILVNTAAGVFSQFGNHESRRVG